MGQGGSHGPSFVCFPLRTTSSSYVHYVLTHTPSLHFIITDSSDEEEGSNDPGVKQKTLIEVRAMKGPGELGVGLPATLSRRVRETGRIIVPDMCVARSSFVVPRALE